MNRFNRAFTALSLLPCTLLGGTSLADEQPAKEPVRLTGMVVREVRPTTESAIIQLEQSAPNPADLAALLRDTAGVTASRMGGQGLDLIIRGQAQDRIHVLNDGLFIFGGCPNRMDPPTLYASPDNSDRILVYRGRQTLEWGSGGPAGTVLIQQRPWLLPDGLSGRISLKGNDNGSRPSWLLDTAWKNERGFLRLNATHDQQGHYRDGQGNKVRSAFRKDAYDLSTGIALDGHQFQLKLAQSRDRDTHYAGAGMDSPESDLNSWQLEYRRTWNHPWLHSLLLEHGQAEVTHVMDNYSLRPLQSPMRMRVPSDAETRTSRIKLRFSRLNVDWLAGMDRIAVDRLAIRYSGMGEQPPAMIQSWMWPDVRQSEAGIYLQGHWQQAGHDLRFGLRSDRMQSTAHAATAQPDNPSLPSALQLWQRYYGPVSTQWDKRHTSAFFHLEQAWNNGWYAWGNVSHSWRMPDATERYMAANSGNPMMRWVGNPLLAAEAHRQLDLGLGHATAAWQVELNLWLDAVQDYILRDRAHGQAGILLADNTTIYRNVNARLYGLTLQASHTLSPRWHLRGSVDYTHGENRTDQRPLAAIPPLSGRLELERNSGRAVARATLRWATAQHRVDDDPYTGSGLDAGPGKGWATVDLSLNAPVGTGWHLAVRLENLLDKTYALHVNRANVDPFNPQPVRVNEPGRTLWLELGWRLNR